MPTPRFLRVLSTALYLALSFVFAAAAQAATGKLVYYTNYTEGDGSTHYQIYFTNPDGSNNTRIVHPNTSDLFPSLSPDGTKILCSIDGLDATGGLRLMNVDGTNITNVPNGTDLILGVWSPDGKRLAARSNTGFATMNVDGTERHEISNMDFSVPDRVNWSPDGTKIVYTARRVNGNRNYYVFTANADGSGGYTKLSQDDSAQYADPTWSPDGTKIAVKKFSTDNFGIYLLDAMTGAETPLRTGDLAGDHPTWSPDGTQLAFESLASDSYGSIGIVNTDGSGFRALSNIGQANYVSWSVAGSGGGANPPTGGNLIVPGTANPFLAGLPAGTTASGGGDSAPAQSPVLVPGLTLNPNKPLNFSVTGSVSNDPVNQPADAPDGNFFFAHDAENGFPKTIAPINSLVGVFLGDAAPDPTVANGATRDFSDAAGTNGGVNFTGYKPDLGVIFFIGDGKTSAGALQNVYPPPGATRLFLGVLDGNDYFDNLGQFKVGVTQNTAIDASDLRVGQSLASAISENGSNALIGDEITYAFHVKNVGSYTFPSVVLADNLPGALQFVRASDGGTLQGNTVTWNLGALAPTGTGTSKDITLTVKTSVSNARINQVVNNSGYFLTGEGLPQTIPGLDLQNTTLLKAPLDVAITGNGATVTPGGTLTYRVDLKNILDVKVKKPAVTLALPPGVKFVEAYYVDDDGARITLTSTDGGVTFTSAAGNFALDGGQTAIFSVANLKSGGSAHLILTVQVPYDVTPDAAINFGSAQLAVKASGGGGTTTYGVIVPDTKLSGVASADLPVLNLLKFVPDPVTVSQAFALESATEPTVAAALQAIFAGVDLTRELDKLQKKINPDVIDGTDEAGFYEQQVYGADLPGSKASTFVAYALVYTNVGNAKVKGVTIQDRVPEGAAYVDGSAALNGSPLDSAKVVLADNGRTLVFKVNNVAAHKPGKPAFGILTYVVRLLPAGQGGKAAGALLEASPAQLNSSSLFHTTASNGTDLRVIGPANLFFEGKQLTPRPQPGDTVAYEAYYKNTGGVTISDASIVNTLPPGATNVRVVFTLGDTGVVDAVADGKVTIHLPALKKKAEGRARIFADLTAASFKADGLLVPDFMTLKSAMIGNARATSRHDGPRTRDLQLPSDVPLQVALYGLYTDPNAPKLFVSLAQPLSVKAGDDYDCLVVISNPTDTPATGVGVYVGVPLGSAYVSSSQSNAKRQSDTEWGNAVYLAPQDANSTVFTLPAHGTLLKRVTFKALAGAGGTALVTPGARTTKTNVPTNGNVTAQLAPVYSGQAATYAYPADQSFESARNEIVSAALTAMNLKVPEFEGLPNFKTKVAALTPNAFGVQMGGADGVSFENNAVVIPLLGGNVAVLGSANALRIPDRSALLASGGGNLVSQDGGGLVASGGGNLIRLTNLVASGGGNLLGADGRDFGTILGQLVASGGGNLVASGGGNLVASGGGNLISQDGGGLVASGGGNLKAGYLISNDGGSVTPVLASSLLATGGLALAASQSELVASGGGNLVASGGGNLVASGGGNLVASGGGNLVASGGGNIVSHDAGGLFPSVDASQAVYLTGNGLVASGGGNIVSHDAGGIVATDSGN